MTQKVICISGSSRNIKLLEGLDNQKGLTILEPYYQEGQGITAFRVCVGKYDGRRTYVNHSHEVGWLVRDH
jgi:hypothetical protein